MRYENLTPEQLERGDARLLHALFPGHFPPQPDDESWYAFPDQPEAWRATAYQYPHDEDLDEEGLSDRAYHARELQVPAGRTGDAACHGRSRG